MTRGFATKTATISNGGTTSTAVYCADAAIFGVVIPSAFTGTSIGFTVSADGTTFQTLYDNTGTIVALTVAASRSLDLPTALAGWHSFKIVSNGAEGAARTIVVTLKG